jgi:hypothetical protein
MTSLHHDGPIDVIRNHPVMTAELVRRVTPLKIPPQSRIRVELGSNDASNVVPDEFKADMVTVIRDRKTSAPLLLVIIEPQGRADKAKKFSWPAYIANLRAAHECESAVLIVICWDAAEAVKCRKAIPYGHPGLVLVPIVIGPHDGEDLDRGSPWLTILAGSIGAIDLEKDTGRRTVLDAIRSTRSNVPVTRTLTAIMLGVASDAARTELEAMMMTKEYKNDFFDRAEALGEARGQARGQAKALVAVLRAKDIELSPEQQELIESCLDLDQFDTWITRAATAGSADDVFKD